MEVSALIDSKAVRPASSTTIKQRHRPRNPKKQAVSKQEVKHRRRRLKRVAGAIPRQPLPEPPAIENTEELCVLRETPTCSWYQRKKAAVEEHPEAYPAYCIQNDRLYRHFWDTNNVTKSALSDPWKLCVPKPSRSAVLSENHDAPTAGHMGISKTIARISNKYYWPGMFRDVAKYVRDCGQCERHRTSQQQTTGKMQPTVNRFLNANLNRFRDRPSIQGVKPAATMDAGSSKSLREVGPPIYLPVHRFMLCWRCGYPGHSRFGCKNPPQLFCSRCGLCGVMSRDCGCRHSQAQSHQPPTPPFSRRNQHPSAGKRPRMSTRESGIRGSLERRLNQSPEPPGCEEGNTMFS